LAFTTFGRTLDRRLVAGDHGLLRLVEIHRLHHLPLSRFGTGFYHRCGVKPHDRGHRTFTGGNGSLHRPRAKFHQRYCILQLQHTGGNQRRILAQAVTGHQGRLRPAFCLPQAVGGNPGGKHQGLGIDGLVQCFCRPVRDQLPQIAAQ
jgi:hypothetical protein